MPTDIEQITTLERRWVEAEIAGDLTALDAMTVAEFYLVGPLGFVLNKQQWLARHAAGQLVTRELTWEDLNIRILNEMAITIGELTQVASFRGNPVSGRFRGSHIYVRFAGGWRLAGQHLSPIGQP
jgi:hypothetical protein